jgi:hypothetical protein
MSGQNSHSDTRILAGVERAVGVVVSTLAARSPSSTIAASDSRMLAMSGRSAANQFRPALASATITQAAD